MSPLASGKYPSLAGKKTIYSNFFQKKNQMKVIREEWMFELFKQRNFYIKHVIA